MPTANALFKKHVIGNMKLMHFTHHVSVGCLTGVHGQQSMALTGGLTGQSATGGIVFPATSTGPLRDVR